jgi:hypothetical protein
MTNHPKRPRDLNQWAIAAISPSSPPGQTLLGHVDDVGVFDHVAHAEPASDLLDIGGFA